MATQTNPDRREDEINARFPHQHGIPTISKFREEKEARRAFAQEHSGSGEGRTQDAGATIEALKGSQDEVSEGDIDHVKRGTDVSESGGQGRQQPQKDDSDANGLKDTSETVNTTDVKQRRQQLKHGGEERAEREVTDPVTHLPVTIQDLTSDALKDVDENEPPFGSTSRSATGLSNRGKSDQSLHAEQIELQDAHNSSKSLFPPPERDHIKKEILAINSIAVSAGLVGSLLIVAASAGTISFPGVGWLKGHASRNDTPISYVDVAYKTFSVALAIGSIAVLIIGVRGWMQKRLDRIWEDEVWEASKQQEDSKAQKHQRETTAWLNSLMSSVWPLVNPDLFLSLADTLEDVMQASLPKMVQMVSVNDIGQGSEALRILAVRWLPSGAAGRSVGKDGSLQSSKEDGKRQSGGEQNGDREEGNKSKDDSTTEKQDDGTLQQIPGGMAAEEGDFVNLEIAFAYRARAGRRTFRDRAKNMHIHMAFYLPGNIKVPVWVDLNGIVGTMRLRLQLCPDPPFFSICTLTFLGQPKVDMSCTPLNRHALNIMDVPLISNFVQSAVDAAMAEYVAPKSLNLDLKDMLAGDDFKKDTHAHGVIVVQINRGFDFKRGDAGVPLVSSGSSDPYVSVGWAKFGKPVWSTRILLDEMEPVWRETAYLLVTPEELNVHERLRVQLWDSDRFTADDDLGRIEVDLNEMMNSNDTKGKMCEREDGFRALKAGVDMPGKLMWSVGYFPKAEIQDCQLQKQTFDPEVRSMQQLKDKVDQVCDRKLREASIKKGRHSRDAQELEQQKKQEFKIREDAMIISAVPPEGYPSGIFSIQIHQITGLELERLHNDYDDQKEEEGEELPSAYCTVVLNHAKVFKTRTKPKNAMPFYNTGTERFVGDWRTAEVFVAVRDARVNEEHPLLGIVHLPLAEVFSERSQVNGFYPITGGVGFGRMRLSMVWRSVQLQAPPQAIGWSYGTVEVKTPVSVENVPEELRNFNLKFHTDIGKGKLHTHRNSDGWNTRKGRSLNLPVRARYASCLAVEFRQHGTLKSKTAAFAVLWLRDIPDDKAVDVNMTVWEGDFERARKNSLDDCGEKLGSIKMKLTFYSGLGAAHSRWANKDSSLHDVVEILDTARDHFEHLQNEKEAGIVDGEVSSDSDDDDDDNDSSDEDDAANGDGKAKSGPIDKVKERVKHEKSLSRHNRGLMQWKAPRTAQWAVGKLESAGDKAKGLFEHHSRQAGIETEV